VKAKNGFWHSFYFTTGRFHEPIRITPSNRAVTEKACRKCHAAIVTAIDPEPHRNPADATSCIRCHSTVGHMR
jgi:cytochrome c nitrite reductase small subunit